MRTKTYLITFAIISLGLATLSSAANHVREIDREYTAAGFESLKVHVPAGSIQATTGPGDIIRIEIDLETKIKDAAKAEEVFAKTEVLFDDSGEILSVNIKSQSRKGFFSIFRGNRDQVTAHVIVTVPENFDAELDTGSGGISADGLMGNIIMDTGSGSVRGRNLTGEIVVDTGSGDVRLENVEGNVNADTGSGSIIITGLNGNLVADTGSGSIQASGNIHTFKADTGSGSIKIQSFVNLTDRSVADTGSGGIRIQLPQTSSFSLDADVGSGAIDCEFPLQSIQQKKHSLKAVANGGGPLLRLDSGSGSILVLPNS